MLGSVPLLARRRLHDSAGHAINVILVQAGAARLLQEQDPARTRAALETIEDVARETVGEIDQLVRALRDDGSAEGSEVEPPPGLAALDTLAERHRTSGLAVVVRNDGGRRQLAPGIDRAAYRILQEALTNAARHGRGSAEVEIAFGPTRSSSPSRTRPPAAPRPPTGTASSACASERCCSEAASKPRPAMASFAVEHTIALRPDVVLMDVRMPNLDGIAATRELLAVSPDVKVVILTTFEQDDYVFGALNAGASGFLLKRTRPEELIAAIHTIAAGDSLLSPSVTRTVIQRMARQPAPIKTHVGRILRKLRLRDRVHAVIFAYESGLTRPETKTRARADRRTVE